MNHRPSLLFDQAGLTPWFDQNRYAGLFRAEIDLQLGIVQHGKPVDHDLQEGRGLLTCSIAREEEVLRWQVDQPNQTDFTLTGKARDHMLCTFGSLSVFSKGNARS